MVALFGAQTRPMWLEGSLLGGFLFPPPRIKMIGSRVVHFSVTAGAYGLEYLVPK
jgi:hypothetical protein